MYVQPAYGVTIEEAAVRNFDSPHTLPLYFPGSSRVELVSSGASLPDFDPKTPLQIWDFHSWSKAMWGLGREF